MAILQVALDLINFHRAIKIAEEAIEGGADWLEAGTPLIKSEGMNVIRELKKTGKKIVADMKTMDVGAVEAEMSAKAGADIICVLGVASNETIKEVVKAGRRYGMEVMVDMLGVSDIERRIKEVEKIGADYICIHTSIDEQMIGKNPFSFLEKISGLTELPVAVAGGINAETARIAVEKGANIVIIGGAIIKAENVAKATRLIKKAIEGAKIKSNEFKKYSKENLFEAFSKVSTCNICDAMHNRGTMRNIRPIKKGVKMIGRAVTVKTMDGDWAKVVEAIDKAKKGDVIVAQAGEGKQAVWGELATLSAYKKGLAGIVIDGAVRDVHVIKEIDLPVFSKKIVSEAGEPKGYGEIGCEIVCGGQIVKNGDWIVGDDNGVVVIPKEEAQEIANRAINVMERENRIREEIKRGETLSKVLNLEKWEVRK
ncbi:MAG TPA: bifunctional hexulose-6-phosphate synthase/ribonuclease regulator [Thermoplasmatales archaeon]|nr:bifunctional hexulose-6-phosphate synthase/ribonuclease regulator [Thermoplasmatales archaeon]